jgi:hypothetical protein
MGDGGIRDGGVVRLGGGERSISFLSSQSLSNSSSFSHFLGFFAGGEAITGDDIRGGDLVSNDAAGAARVGGSERAGQSGAAVAALLRLRR